MKLKVIPERLAVVHNAPDQAIPEWVYKGTFMSITRTRDELSIFCDESVVPEDLEAARGWRAIMVQGPIDLELSGIISLLAMPLAAKQIPIFSISTYETDYMIVRDHRLEDAMEILRRAGHEFV